MAPTSIALYEAAQKLTDKGHYARGAEKFGAAAAAASQELAAEDCLVVAFLRAAQAESLNYHSWVPTLPVTEAGEARLTIVSVLLPQLMSTLTRRMAAGTLLPGNCRAAKVAWLRAAKERKMLETGVRVEVARACGVAVGPAVGFEAYVLAANVILVVLSVLTAMPREMQLSYAVFVASAFDLMAHPCELPCPIVDGVKKHGVPSTAERMLARSARMIFRNADVFSFVDGEAFSLLADAWQRVERSGAIAMRELDDTPAVPRDSINASFDAAAAEGAVRGLQTCALADCAAKEVHVSQFKRCGACRTVAYCCREHQVEDWPAHKAACKAARKTAADPPAK